ncbi:unnamed protein product [Orchesella dallaii]|uniref:Tetraspanin n=1 Tax=Orchesella dallaii TaxID=48710 RepID=A0ABP1PU80_9HEXA
MMSNRKYEKSEGWCSKSLLRNYLYIFNFFFLCGAIAVLLVAVWSVLAEHGFISLLSDVSYPWTSYLLLAAGALGLIAAVFGCCGIAKSDRCYLFVYILLLLLIFLLEVMAGSLAFIYREQAYQELETRLNVTFIENYGKEPVDDAPKTRAIDEMQREFHCCGANSYEDWMQSRWLLDGLAGTNKVPDSCCKTEGTGCGVRDHPSNIYYTGCIHMLSDTVRNHLGYLTISGLGLCILQIIGVIFSTCLYIKLKQVDITDL